MHETIRANKGDLCWALLRPRPEIILFGDEPGTAALCREFGLGHVPELACSELGAPLLPDLFEKAQRTAAHDLLCYVNSDIMLMGDFLEALRSVSDAQKRFLMVGRRWDASIREPWDFDTRGGENDLRISSGKTGSRGYRLATVISSLFRKDYGQTFLSLVSAGDGGILGLCMRLDGLAPPWWTPARLLWLCIKTTTNPRTHMD